MKQKYYVVKHGKTPGIYLTWNECLDNIKGVSGAIQQSFTNKDEAEAFFSGVDLFENVIENDFKEGYVVAFTDGSYNKALDKYSAGALLLQKVDNRIFEEEYSSSFNNAKYSNSDNVAGEIMAVIKALNWALSVHATKIKIYYDYQGIGKWISKEWVANAPVAKMFLKVFESDFQDVLQVDFSWIKGHSNNKYHDRADVLAKGAFDQRVSLKNRGDSWCVVQGITNEKLTELLRKIQMEFPEVKITDANKPDKIIFNLSYLGNKLCVTKFNRTNGKLLIQGKQTTLYQILITYLNEEENINIDRILESTYERNIDKSLIDKDFGKLFDVLPLDYPATLRKLIRQSLINIRYSTESEDYTQYIFPSLRALEGHIKYLFLKEGHNVTSPFNMFSKDTRTGCNKIQNMTIKNDQRKAEIEKCYDYFCIKRHPFFHYGDLYGTTDSTPIIDKKEVADEIISKCLSFISGSQF